MLTAIDLAFTSEKAVVHANNSVWGLKDPVLFEAGLREIGESMLDLTLTNYTGKGKTSAGVRLGSGCSWLAAAMVAVLVAGCQGL